jgi:hypothetical protein
MSEVHGGDTALVGGRMRYAIRFESSSPLPGSTEKTIYENLVAALGRIENFEVTTGAAFIGRIQSNDRPIVWVETSAESCLP